MACRSLSAQSAATPWPVNFCKHLDRVQARGCISKPWVGRIRAVSTVMKRYSRYHFSNTNSWRVERGRSAATYLNDALEMSHTQAPSHKGRAAFWRYLYAREVHARTTMDSGTYQKWQQAVERQLSDLFVGRAASVNDLCKFLVFKHAMEWRLLHLVIGCVERMMEANSFPLNEACRFLFTVGFHPKRDEATCERLQCIVDTLEKSIENIAASEFLQGLLGASHINALRVVSLMEAAESIFGKKLHDLAPLAIIHLARASVLISVKQEGYDGTDLCCNVHEEYRNRIVEFSPQQCVLLLSGMAQLFYQTHQRREVMNSTFQASEQHLLSAMDILTPNEIADLCIAFNMCSYKPKLISFNCILHSRLKHLPPTMLTTLLHFEAKNGDIEEAVLEYLMEALPKNVYTWKQEDLSLLLTSLRANNQPGRPRVMELILIIKREVIRRFSINQQPFSPGVSVKILYNFAKLKTIHPIMGKLFSTAMSSFDTLSQLNLGQLMCAISLLHDAKPCIETLHQAFCSASIRAREITCTFESMSLLSRGFARLRLVEDMWLQKIADHCRSNMTVLMTKHINELVVILRSIAHLRFPQPELFLDVKNVLERLPAESIHAWPGKIVDISLACALQDCFPVETLKQLCGQNATLQMLDNGDRCKLLDIDLVWQCRFKAELISVQVRDMFLRARHPRLSKLPHSVIQCCHWIHQLLPPGHVHHPVVVGGRKIACAVLKRRDGYTAEWPEEFPMWPSAGDIQLLLAYGLQPVGILVHSPMSLTWNTGTELAPMVMKRYTLLAYKWEVLAIPTADFGRCSSPDQREQFLRSQFEKCGIKVEHGHTNPSH